MSAKPVVLKPDDKITKDDLAAKFREFRGDVDEKVDAVKVPAIAIVAGAVVLAIVAAYGMGRRRGKKRQTVLEIRRI